MTGKKDKETGRKKERKKEVFIKKKWWCISFEITKKMH